MISIVFLFFQKNRGKIYKITRNELPLDALGLACDRVSKAVSVQMPINTALYAVFFEQFDDSLAAVGRVQRRIVQEADDLLRLLCGAEPQRRLKSQQLAPEDLLVVRVGKILLERPAARAAQRRFFP